MAKGGICGEGGCAWQRGHVSQTGACVVKGDMHGEGACVARGPCMAKGACMANGGMHGKGGVCMAGEMATAADSMHPKGMHSCFTSRYPCNAQFNGLEIEL